MPILTSRTCRIAVILLLTFACGCARKPPIVTKPVAAPAAVPVVGVGLACGVSRAGISCTKKMKVVVKDDPGTEPLEAEESRTLYLVPRDNTVHLVEHSGEEVLMSGERLAILPASDGALLLLGGKAYRGSFEAFSRSGQLTVVNVVEVEEYLRGVVAPEIGNLSQSGFQALKAQAVAARTYVCAHFGHRADKGFDVFPTVEDQVYAGVSAEEKLSDKAVAETKGVVLTYGGKLIEAYYSSCCGGRSADAGEGWARDAVPYLASRWDRTERSDGYLCEISPNYRWKAKWSGSELKAQVASFLESRGEIREGEDIGEILDVVIKEKGRSGRVIQLEIKTSKRTVRLDRYEIRRALKPPGLGGRGLNSTLFKIDVRYSGRRVKGLSIHGGGHGHGVGMCQWGAIRMSQLGHTYRDILKHYYKGVDVVRIY